MDAFLIGLGRGEFHLQLADPWVDAGLDPILLDRYEAGGERLFFVKRRDFGEVVIELHIVERDIKSDLLLRVFQIQICGVERFACRAKIVGLRERQSQGLRTSAEKCRITKWEPIRIAWTGADLKARDVRVSGFLDGGYCMLHVRSEERR